MADHITDWKLLLQEGRLFTFTATTTHKVNSWWISCPPTERAIFYILYFFCHFVITSPVYWLSQRHVALWKRGKLFRETDYTSPTCLPVTQKNNRRIKNVCEPKVIKLSVSFTRHSAVKKIYVYQIYLTCSIASKLRQMYVLKRTTQAKIKSVPFND